MERLPTISVITPSFNQAQFIEKTIRSVLDQGYPNLEYWVVDGGSTDGTIEILRRFGDRIHWVSEPDAGQSDAINKGMRKATGEIVTYLNSDDMLLPGSLHTVGRFFLDHPDVEWLTGRCEIVDEQDRPVRSAIADYKNFLLRHYSFNLLGIINFISQMSTFWRRSAMESVGYFPTDHHLVMDYVFWLRLASRSDPAVLSETLSAFRIQENAKSSKQFIRQFQESFGAARQYLRNPALRTISWVHNYAVIAIYQLMSWKRQRPPV